MIDVNNLAHFPTNGAHYIHLRLTLHFCVCTKRTGLNVRGCLCLNDARRGFIYLKPTNDVCHQVGHACVSVLCKNVLIDNSVSNVSGNMIYMM